MATRSPVKPAVLAWILKQDGRTVEEIADASQIAPDAMYAWLAGADSPTAGEVSRLAAETKRPRAAFLLPEPPAGPVNLPSFRSALGSKKPLSKAARQAVRESRQVQKVMAWVRSAEADVGLPTASESAEAAAELTRAWLGTDRSRWGDPYSTLGQWRALLDREGVLVFSLQIGRGDIRGFSLPDPKAPVIGVNQSGNTPEVRIFSILHELGHLVRGAPSTCLDFGEAGVSDVAAERWCERFAGAVLMPKNSVAELLGDGMRGQAGIDEVKKLTRRYCVSARAAAVRLDQLGFARPSLYGEVSAVFRPKAQKKPDRFFSPPRHTARMRQYGPGVLVDVLNALPPRDALSALRIDANDAREIAAELPEVNGY